MDFIGVFQAMLTQHFQQQAPSGTTGVAPDSSGINRRNDGVFIATDQQLAEMYANEGSWWDEAGGRWGGAEQFCVPLVRHVARAPATTNWRKGLPVKGNLAIPKGTAIATFENDGTYKSHATGNHAAVYIKQTSKGLIVWDQYKAGQAWQAKPASVRTLPFLGDNAGHRSRNGDCFFVVQSLRLHA